jgi:hypothetical protein
MSVKKAFLTLLLAMPLTAQDRSTLAGTVHTSGDAVPNVKVRLQSESSPTLEFNTTSDRSGIYRFEGLPPGMYTLTLMAPIGLHSLTIISISAPRGETTIRPLELAPAGSCGEGEPAPDYFELLAATSGVGDLSGTVRVIAGPQGTGNPPAPADVSLICAQRTLCASCPL